jgi:hypothetical protein
MASLLLTSCSSVKVPAPAPSAKIAGEVSEGILGGWEQLGIQKGQPIPDVGLFTPEGKPFNVASEVRGERPIVLVSGSYTCDVSRNNLEAIKGLAKEFGKDAKFFMVYTIEPHPYDAASPYSAEGKVWVAKNNARDKVKAAQPKTYKERVELARRWKDEYSIPLPLLIDGPENVYWKKFGQAPNMVYIISADRKVVYKQAWFNESKLKEQLVLLKARS